MTYIYVSPSAFCAYKALNHTTKVSIKCQMSKTSIGGAMSRVQAPAAEEMLDGVVCSREQFSFQMCLESGDRSGTEGTCLLGTPGYNF